ncbi:TetR family transcriptional regulator [Amycolatopsis sulphurea]|uniref:TetR family transcriptional regulator n=1 Tax=Amycolatopsis sulphurea TaxID=76022 RepID=A0A2A9FDA3_9PSEU|nr:TetR/AcrR family transcriptional regulator [Amycolatopsis sulphurea]PFG49334.1 TetR family transcriptional regulator [Amycolatopsis sulphurea]
MTESGFPPPPDGRAARWAGQRERRRQEFVDAGLRAIARYGPEASTEQIADAAGVARTRVYKHFTDAADLQQAIARRAAEMIAAEFEPLATAAGTTHELVRSAIGTHIEWVVRHRALYQYLVRHSSTGSGDAVADVKTVIAGQLAIRLDYYLGVFGADRRIGETLVHGLVGFIEASTARWLDEPRELGRGELCELLARSVWAVLDDLLRAGGIVLNPDSPLSDPDFRRLR